MVYIFLFYCSLFLPVLIKNKIFCERRPRYWTVISYHVPDLVNMSGVSVTNVKHFMSCVAIINTPISSV